MNYKIYESDITEYLKKVVNKKIISDIIDLSLEFLEDGYELLYFDRIKGLHPNEIILTY